MKNIFDPFGFAAAFGVCSTKTATVYQNGEKFATYSIDFAKEVAQEIRGCVMDDDTGEIIADFEL